MDARPPVRVRHSSSQYDFVKLRVWLGDGEDRHATVLSRFLLCRTLTAARVPYDAAVKIALEVKKTLVDGDMLDVSQAQLEGVVFRVMRKRTFGDEYVSRYKMLTAFHVKRAPLLVLIGGSVCTGKSTVAAKLSQRLNLPNMVQTDVIHEVLRSSNNQDDVLHAQLWDTEDTVSEADLLLSFERQCGAVSEACDSILRKCLVDGKALVLEGLHCHMTMLIEKVRVILAELADKNTCLPVIVPISLYMCETDRELLLSAWIAKQRNDTSPTRTLQSIRKGVDRLDRVLSASGAHTAALQISVKPAEPSEALNLIHDQVLRRVKECVDSG